MRVLGIETSCDETAVALIERASEGPYRIVAEEISSQVSLHAKFGGVVPELASREHLSALPLLLDIVLQKGGGRGAPLDLIAVTRGPGLKGCLLVGYSFARSFALVRGVPVMPVNHIEGHLLVPMLDNPTLKPPYLALVVSGGHTEIIKVNRVGEYEVRARTRDDAAGEAFDKSAYLLGLPYPGGPKLAALADSVTQSRFTLPRVMREGDGFSFSGLKTAISLLVKKTGVEALQDAVVKAELCWSVQEAIVDTLVHKVRQEIDATGIRQVVVTGGVSANRRLKQALGQLSSATVFAPLPHHSTDNAAMIACAGAMRFEVIRTTQGIEKDVAPSWRVEDACAA